MSGFVKRWFRTYFVAGTLVLVPLIVTIWILKGIITTADSFLIEILPRRVHPEALFGKHIPGLGLVATIALVMLTGFFARLYVGKKAIYFGDWIISKIPLGRTIYGGLKQFLGTLFGRDGNQYKSVAIVEYPRRDCFALGFITSEPIPLIQKKDPRRWVNVFIPTTPNPTSGFLIMLPEEDITPLNISIEYAFKLIISGGIVHTPPPPLPHVGQTDHQK